MRHQRQKGEMWLKYEKMKQIDCFLEIGGYISGVPTERRMVRHGAKGENKIQVRKKMWLVCYAILNKMATVLNCVHLFTVKYSSIIMFSK